MVLAGLGRHHNLDHVVDGDGFSDDIFTKRLVVPQSNQTEEMLWSLWFEPPPLRVSEVPMISRWNTFWKEDPLEWEPTFDHQLKSCDLNFPQWTKNVTGQTKHQQKESSWIRFQALIPLEKKIQIQERFSHFRVHQKLTLLDSKNGASLLLQSKRFMTGGVVDEICSIPRFSRCKIWVFYEMLFINLYLAILCALFGLFGMLRRLSHLQLGDQKVTLNHLVDMAW